MNPPPFDPNDRLPPSDRSAEICVLGAMILDASVIDEAASVLSRHDFFDPAHGLIFDLLVTMHGKDDPVDLVTVKAAALEAGILDQIGGVDGLLSIVDGVPSTSNLAHYAGIVKALSNKRRILRLAVLLQAAAFNPTVTAADLLETAESGLDQIATGRADERIISAQEAAESVLRDVQAAQAGDTPPGVMTSLEAIDAACGGMRPGELIVLAGATGSGKSTLADSIAVYVAAGGQRVLIASVEMLADERAQRILQIIGQVDGARMRKPQRLDAADWQALHEATERLRGMRLDFVTGELSTADVVSAAKRVKKRWGGLDLVVVDYLQLLTPTREQGTRRAEQVSAQAWAMKMQLAVGLKVPVLLLSQLTRSDLREDKPPSKFALKESGDIENHSNAIWLLWRPALDGKYASWCAGDETLFCQDKHRSMPLTPWSGPAAVRLKWSRRTTTFSHAYRGESFGA